MEDLIVNETAKNGVDKKNQEAKTAFNWIAGIIDSCQNTFHLQCAKLLVERFKVIYADKYGGKGFLDELHSKLIDCISKIEIV